jgi:nitrate/nitrite transporter NarK
MAQKSMGANAFFAVVMLAVGNAGGRIAAGTLSDKIGRPKTLGIVFTIQAMLMFAAIPITGATGASAAITALLVLLSAAIGFNYGANLSLFPSFAKDMWGIKNFGMNYGVLFTAWGVGGFVMSKASERLATATGTFSSAFLLAGIMLLLGSTLTFFVKDEKSRKRAIVAKVLQDATAKA